MIGAMIARSRAAAGRAKRISSRAVDELLSRVMPVTHAAMQTRRDFEEYERRVKSEVLPRSPSAEVASMVVNLRRTGWHVVENYWDREMCARAVADVERIFRDHPRFVRPNPKSDIRLFGADALSPLIGRFGHAPGLAEVATLHNRIPTRLGMTLAARLAASEGNVGSGEGWHRDQFCSATKAMLYLTDVGPENGPFQMLQRSFECEDVCRDVRRAPLAHMQYRVSERQVASLLEEDTSRLKTFCAPAGTLIVFNASAIHRGKPIGSSVRYALTNYYFTRHWSDEEIAKEFAPVATSRDVLNAASA
jgi:hypothetical protein